jgi:predicted NBD/HSP70 family sugar kinase
LGHSITGVGGTVLTAQEHGVAAPAEPGGRSQLCDAQLAEFTATAMQATPTGSFDPRQAAEELATPGGRVVTAVDIGGDKLTSCVYSAGVGVLRQGEPRLRLHASAGAGYLGLLQEISAAAEARSSALGISYAGPVQGTRILAGPNLAEFVDEFRDAYGSDFARLNSQSTLVNDGEAGLLAGALEAVRRYPAVRNVILVINGSGLGCAVLKAESVFTTEAGHVPVHPALNPFGQLKPCGLHGAGYVCVENVGASKAGIEDIWWQSTGGRASGHEIAAALADGNELASQLYENSAMVIAHAVKGAANVFGLVDDWAATAIVGHGGAFQVRGYPDRVRAILEGNLGAPTRLFVSTDFTANACLDGAAIAALFRRPANR